ncbi:MAG TPA: sulfotransferase domain-containing protein [Pseudonocardiaceae bacterium]|nr:sulfotransferase domain-containing protein [Pseudonocardiaceae bacterium]
MGERELVRYRGLVYDSDRWRGFVFRPGDIVISTPPKCGTTWTQMICALLVLQEPVLTQPLSVLSPWLDMLSRARRDVLADLEAQRHRRFIKTHTPLDGLPLDTSVTYICVGRDPRDVALSMDHHRANMDFDAFLAARNAAASVDGITPEQVTPPSWADGERQRFWAWVDDDTPPTELASSLLRTLHHLQSFWDAPESVDVVMVHFDDLRADLEGQMRALADRLAITVPEAQWPELVSAATFDEMRARAALTAPNAQSAIWHDNERFFHRGTSGQWRDLLDDDDLERYRARAKAIGSAAVVDWVHRGSL